MIAPPLLIRIRSDFDQLGLGGTPKAALFLDRDGVINVDTGYLADPKDVALIGGVAEAIGAANRRGMPVIVVSNQSGVGRGYNDWAAVVAVDDRLVSLLATQGAHYDAALYAGAAPDSEVGASYRKPMSGMLKMAGRIMPVDFATSWIVGDKTQDLEAGANAGLAGGVLVGDAQRLATDLDPSTLVEKWGRSDFRFHRAVNLAAAWTVIEANRLSLA